MMAARNRKAEPKGPDWPPEKTLRVLKQQLNELQKFRGRNYREAAQEEEVWDQFTRSAIVHGFGEESQNSTNFNFAKWAGQHQIGGMSEQQRQKNFELRIDKFDATLTSSIKELELMLPETHEEIKPAGAGSPSKITVDIAASLNEKAVAVVGNPQEQWDVFISHASEDKDAIARPLAESLSAKGLSVWYDESSLKLGDSLRQSIDRGLARSRFGVVILSPHFFEKHWPAQELNGLATREVNGKKVILPVWHNVGFNEVRGFSPTLADRVAVSTERGLERVVAMILEAIK